MNEEKKANLNLYKTEVEIVFDVLIAAKTEEEAEEILEQKKRSIIKTELDNMDVESFSDFSPIEQVEKIDNLPDDWRNAQPYGDIELTCGEILERYLEAKAEETCHEDLFDDKTSEMLKKQAGIKDGC